MLPNCPSVDIQAIGQKAKEYFFMAKNNSKEVRREVFKQLLQTVEKQIKPVVEFCESLSEADLATLPWNIRLTVEQIRQHAGKYLLDVAHFTKFHSIKAGKILSFHAEKIACISKGKFG